LFDEGGPFQPQVGINPDADPPTGEIWVAVTMPFDLNPVATVLSNGETIYKDWDFALNMEFYAINNDGKILDITKLMNGDLGDPFSVMKVIGGECIISGNDSTPGKPYAQLPEAVQKFEGDNIDIVVTPDLALAAIQQSLSALPSMLEDLTKDGSGEDNTGTE